MPSPAANPRAPSSRRAAVRVRDFGARPARDGDARRGHSAEARQAKRAFAADWAARLARAPHANFTLSLDYLAQQAACGHPSRAVLLDEGSRHGAMVLRLEGGEVACGYPWRWQMVIEGSDPRSPQGMTPDDAEWFFEHAQRLAGRRRLRFHTPHALPSTLDYLAASTVLIDLAHATEEQLLAGLDASRRRLARRSAKQGYDVVDAATPELQRSFDALVEDTGVRRHGLARRGGARDDAAGSTSEWAQPWHWLLVAVRDGRVAAGLGMGRQRGGMVDGRASGATDEAMRAGTNSLVWWEAIRRARLAGHTWMNLGGSTIYKREFGGVLVPIHCRLGGGGRWFAPNLAEKAQREGLALAVRTRNRLRALRRVHPRGPAD